MSNFTFKGIGSGGTQGLGGISGGTGLNAFSSGGTNTTKTTSFFPQGTGGLGTTNTGFSTNTGLGTSTGMPSMRIGGLGTNTGMAGLGNTSTFGNTGMGTSGLGTNTGMNTGGFGNTGMGISGLGTTGTSFGMNTGGFNTSNTSGGYSGLGGNTTMEGGLLKPGLTNTSTGLNSLTGGSNLGMGSNIGGGNLLGTMQPNNNNNTNQNKKENDKWEIKNVIQNYLNCIDPGNQSNAFKYMLFNRIPKGQEYQHQAYQSYRPREKGDDGTEMAVDYSLWVKALTNNPLPTLYYPHQISSPSQLVARAKTTEVLEFSALETIISLQNNLNQLNNKYDIEIQSEAALNKKKLQLIKNKQMTVISKLERLSLITGKADKNFHLENVINSKLNNLKTVLTENNEYTSKIKELSSMIQMTSFESPLVEDKDYLKDIDSERFDKNINILREMKKVFDVTFSSLKQNMAVMNFIKTDLDILKKYGKIPK